MAAEAADDGFGFDGFGAFGAFLGEGVAVGVEVDVVGEPHEESEGSEQKSGCHPKEYDAVSCGGSYAGQYDGHNPKKANQD